MWKVIAYFATSLDGFIADPQGWVSWLDTYNQSTQDYGYKSFYADIDTVIMWRKTYEAALEMGKGKREFADKISYVLTSNANFQDNPQQRIYFSSDIDHILWTQQDKTVRVLGWGKLYNDMTQNKQIETYIITVVPTVLWQGIPRIHQQHNFQVQQVQHFENGVVQYTMTLV